MNALLHEFLLENGKVLLPEVGVLSSQTEPAKYNIAYRKFEAPKQTFSFDGGDTGNALLRQQFLGFYSQRNQISEEDAWQQMQHFGNGLAEMLKKEGQLNWLPEGVFRKKDSGEIVFEPATEITAGFTDLTAERVIRSGATHQMVVGDTEKTNVEMEALLGEEEIKPDRWWLWPLVIGAAAIILIALKRFL